MTTAPSSQRPRHPGQAHPGRSASAAAHPGRWAAALLWLPLCFAAASGAQAAPDAAPAAQPGLQVCSIIVEARAVPGGAALRFHETTGVNFSDRLGNRGRIHGRQVIRYAREPNGPDLPAEPTLTVHSGAELTLSEHHFGCTVAVETVDGSPVLKVRKGMSYPGIPARTEEGVVPLQ